MKGIIAVIVTMAMLSIPTLTGPEAHRQPLQIAEIGCAAVPAVVKSPEARENGLKSVLIAKGEFPIVEEAPAAPEPIVEAVAEVSGGWQYYGVCTVTHYCACEKCCGQWASGYTASGTLATANRTVAADLPFGTRLLINGQEYIVEDRGVGGMWVDIFVNSHEEAYARGMFEADVYIWQ